jgi:hypothetical protein
MVLGHLIALLGPLLEITSVYFGSINRVVRNHLSDFRSIGGPGISSEGELGKASVGVAN